MSRKGKYSCACKESRLLRSYSDYYRPYQASKHSCSTSNLIACLTPLYQCRWPKCPQRIPIPLNGPSMTRNFLHCLGPRRVTRVSRTSFNQAHILWTALLSLIYRFSPSTISRPGVDMSDNDADGRTKAQKGAMARCVSIRPWSRSFRPVTFAEMGLAWCLRCLLVPESLASQQPILLKQKRCPCA